MDNKQRNWLLHSVSGCWWALDEVVHIYQTPKGQFVMSQGVLISNPGSTNVVFFLAATAEIDDLAECFAWLGAQIENAMLLGVAYHTASGGGTDCSQVFGPRHQLAVMPAPCQGGAQISYGR